MSLDPHVRLVEHRHQQICHRHVFHNRERKVAPPLQPASATPNEEVREVVGVVHIGFAKPGPVEDDDVVEQRAVTIRRRPQLLGVGGDQA